MGYVGIPVAALFADVEGFHVTGLQRRSERSGWKIDALNRGISPIGGDEPGLQELIERVVEKGTFNVTNDIQVYGDADVIIITVQTPVDENHNPMYGSLRRVCEDLGRHMNKDVLVSLESTVAPGTTKHIVKPILEGKSGLEAGADFNLVYSYERVMVGRLLHNLTMYPRIVGGLTEACTRSGMELYGHIVKAELIPTDSLTAEVAKVTENAYRDVNIAFSNEIAILCESLGVNVHDVRRMVNSLPNDPSNPAANPYRNMLIPGAGVGGHCLPKDSWLLKYGVETYGDFKYEPTVIVSSRHLNEDMPRHMSQLLMEALDENSIRIRESRLTILGLSFKENSDDPRNTPSFHLYTLLRDRCRDVIIHDPHIKAYRGVPLTNDLEEALRNRDAVLVVTGHREYKGLSLERVRTLMRSPIIVDGRNVFDYREARGKGFTFKGVGIPRR